MINDGLHQVSRPDYALCYHLFQLPDRGYWAPPSPIFAGVTLSNMKFFGIGGHSTMPHRTKLIR